MSILPVVLDTWSRAPSLWEFLGTCIEPDELWTSIINTNPFALLKCRRPSYLSRNLDETVKYACFYNNYLYLYRSSISPGILHSMAFSDVTLLEIRLGENIYSINIQISHDPIDEGELSLLFKFNGTVLYTVSFTIIPGYAVGLPDRHTLLISRMQGSRAKFQDIRHATKEMNDISPQALLIAALEGIAMAIGVAHVAGVSAANLASFSDQTAEFLSRVYDDFYKTIGIEPLSGDFYLMTVPFPKKALRLAKPGHRLRTKLKQKTKTDFAKSVCASWRKTIAANDSDTIPASGGKAEMPIAEAWFQTGSLADELHLHFSANPTDGRDWPRTLFLAEKLRARFPDAAAGYQIGTNALRELNRLDQALAVATEAMARFPDEAWAVAEAARVARALGDTAEAIRLAAELRRRAPDDRAGYQIGATALRETHRLEEAASVAADATVRFPMEPWPMVEAAWIARARGDADGSLRLAAELRHRFPDSPAGYRIGAAALRETRRFDEAASVAAAAMTRFPADVWPLAEAAWVARARGESDRAVRLAAELRFRFPDEPAGYQIGAAELREQHRLDEATAVAAEGIARFPAEAWPVAEAAWIAKELGDSGEAIRLAAELRSRFPDDPTGRQIAQIVPSVVEFGR
jgi:uncharacterized protein VirK/YbjX/tetratricopeptide (TPR) repeat protein